MILGKHTICDLKNCNKEILNDLTLIETIVLNSAKEANLHVVEFNFHKFNPIGISGVTILAESHITIHTWPEYGFAAIDAFTCGESFDPTQVCRLIGEKLESQEINLSELKRGEL